MKQREYAVSLGLAKPGGRGRLSAAAIEAIEKAVAEGKRFSDYKPNSHSDSTVSVDDVRPVDIKPLPETHKYSTVYGIDTKLRRPVLIAFQWCAKCLLQVKYCMHDVPQLPEYMGGGNAYLSEAEARAAM